MKETSMSPEHSRHLTESYPILYRGKDKPLTESLMAFGFECGDGWFDLLDELSRGIEEINLKIMAPPWHVKAWNWVRGRNTVPVHVEALQVKEKFGTLRYHCSRPAAKLYWNAVSSLIDEAELRSETTCESCGSPGGKVRSGKNWFAHNRCDKCWDHEERAPKKMRT
jgi:hypothetical protein